VASAAVAREPLVVSPIGAEITVGARPPDFTARAHDGRRIRLSELEGKVVVLYFYPKDETPGCTAEACAFRDAWAEIEKSGAVLVGISTDSDASHRAFAAHHRLPFLLVSDPDGELARAYGVPVRLSFTSRQSFVVGRDGKVRKIYRSVDVKVHAAEILADVRAP
jgi:peroxiredoxin Q/BCP